MYLKIIEHISLTSSTQKWEQKNKGYVPEKILSLPIRRVPEEKRITKAQIIVVRCTTYVWRGRGSGFIFGRRGRREDRARRRVDGRGDAVLGRFVRRVPGREAQRLRPQRKAPAHVREDRRRGAAAQRQTGGGRHTRTDGWTQV